MPYYTYRTETVVGVSIAIVVVEVEQTCIGTIIIVASTFEERVRRVHKVRVRFSFIPINCPFYASLRLA